MSAEFVDNLFSHLAAQQGKTDWCEDTPFNTLHSDFLFQLFPDMKLLYIFRDPRDVVCSYLHHNWAPNTVEQASVWLSNILAGWEESKGRFPAGSFLEIRFEELVWNAQDAIQEICDFLQIHYEATMLDLDMSHHHIGRWKRELSKSDHGVVEKYLGDFIAHRNY